MVDDSKNRFGILSEKYAELSRKYATRSKVCAILSENYEEPEKNVNLKKGSRVKYKKAYEKEMQDATILNFKQDEKE